MQVDTILAHGTIVTMDDAFTLIEDGAVAMRGDSIADLGPTDRILRDHTAREVIDCHECAIIPGLINDLWEAVKAGDLKRAMKIQDLITPLIAAIVGKPDFSAIEFTITAGMGRVGLSAAGRSCALTMCTSTTGSGPFALTAISCAGPSTSRT